MLSLLLFIVTLVIIVGVHELGHYGAARMCGVKVLAFSIGLGPPILSRRDRHGTEWRLAPIPLGGYVSMLQDPAEAVKAGEPPTRALDGIPRWWRAWVIFAGPLANFVLTFVLFYVTALMGEASLRAVVGRVEPGSMAAMAGLVAGDEIIAVDGRETVLWSKVVENLVFAVGDHDAQLEVRSSTGIKRTLRLPTGGDQGIAMLGAQGFLVPLGIVPDSSFVLLEIDVVMPDTPAASAGLRPGDTVVAMGDTVVEDWGQVVEAIRAAPAQELAMVVARDGLAVTLAVVPAAREGGGYLGVMPRIDADRRDALLAHQRAGPLAALGEAWSRTVRAMATTARFLRLMFGGGVSTDNLSGPVGIAAHASVAAGLGLVVFLQFIAQLSLGLGLINLLPVPLLDGGHLLRYGIEGTIGRPLPHKMLVAAAYVGAGLIIALMVFAFYNDLT